MIINQNNKNNLKGTVQRGFNQNPNDLREKLQTATKQTVNKSSEQSIPKTNNTKTNLRHTLDEFKRLKWKSKPLKQES